MVSLGKTELDDVYGELLLALEDGSLYSVLEKANRMGEIERFLDSIGMKHLVDGYGYLRHRKILVIGDSQVSEGRLKTAAKKMGYDPTLFDFILDYDQASRYGFRSLRRSPVYGLVVFGAVSHSTEDKGDYESIIAKMKAETNDYPLTIDARDEAGELKLTLNSFKKALEEAEQTIA